MKKITVFTFSILFFEFMLLSGCKNRETGIALNTNADPAGEEAMDIDIGNDTKELISAAVIEQINGITNSNGVFIREDPSLDAAVIGRFEKGILFTVLGRSSDRMFLNGYDSFWLRVKTDDVEGWAYGAYVNLLNSQYETLPVLSDVKQMGIVDLNWSRKLPEHELIQKEREAIVLQSDRFMDISIKDFYDAIVSAFNQQKSLRPFFLNTQQAGIFETDSHFYISSSSLSDYIQASYVDNITIGPLITTREKSASFVINGFKKKSTITGIKIGAIAVNIRRINSTSFIPLEGKTVIDRIGFSPESAEDFIERSWGDADRFNAVTADSVENPSVRLFYKGFLVTNRGVIIS